MDAIVGATSRRDFIPILSGLVVILGVRNAGSGSWLWNDCRGHIRTGDGIG